MKIKRGDNVIVTAGKDRGKTGKVVRALPREDRVIIEGVNVRKKHQRPTRRTQKGQILDIAMPVHISNVQIVDSQTDKPSRIGYRMEHGKKVRFAKKSNTPIE